MKDFTSKDFFGMSRDEFTLRSMGIEVDREIVERYGIISTRNVMVRVEDLGGILYDLERVNTGMVWYGKSVVGGKGGVATVSVVVFRDLVGKMKFLKDHFPGDYAKMYEVMN